ncbi:MAG: class I SAM-dependent methyltransferase [Alphaproteobacteria bacterium]
MPSRMSDWNNADATTRDMRFAGVQKVTGRDITRLPGVNGWMRAALAIVAHVSVGSLVIVLPDGRKLKFDGAAPGETGVVQVRDTRFAKKLLTGGGIGFAEAYLDGQWDTPDLQTLLSVIALNNNSIGANARGKWWVNILEHIRHSLLRKNSRRGARRNIEYHYDLGNDFYSLWLDAGMTYSSALFKRADESLEQAQHNKYSALAQRIALHPDHHLLEIGCGWGGFAEFAAGEIGCKVTGITISQEQYAFSKKRIFENGLAEKVDIVIQDYRDLSAQYDRIASIEMFEAVGEAYWPHYFSKLHDSLKQGGLAGLQLITIADRYFESYRHGQDFIQRYIFPGGMLPSPAALSEQISHANLHLREQFSFGIDYAHTLRRWHEKFQKKWPEIEKLGFDTRFRRMWTYYLAYCESGFSSHNTDVVQMTLARA